MTKELDDKEEEIEELLEEIERMKKEENERESKQNRAKNNKKEVNNDIRNNPPNNAKPVRDDKDTDVEEKKDDKVNDSDNNNNNNDVTNNSTNNDVHSTTSGDAELIEVEATFYTAMCDTGCTGTTATGLNVKDTIYTDEGNRIIAVDPSVIPLGSTVKVSLEDGTTFTASAEDTGGDIKGQRIDILVESKEEAERMGRQNVKIELIS